MTKTIFFHSPITEFQISLVLLYGYPVFLSYHIDFSIPVFVHLKNDGPDEHCAAAQCSSEPSFSAYALGSIV